MTRFDGETPSGKPRHECAGWPVGWQVWARPRRRGRVAGPVV